MAKAKGIVKIEGTLEDLTFYQKNGKNYVRRKGGVSASRIATDANFVRTRENNHEFTSTANAGKMLRLALGSLVFKAKDAQMSNRLHQVMAKIKNLDSTSTRGNRSVTNGLTTAAGKLALTGFDFNENAKLSSVLFAPFALDESNGRVTIDSIITEEQLLYPQGATHVSMQASVLGIDFETGTSELVSSPVSNLPISMAIDSVSLNPPSMPATTGVTVFLFLISFYQEINGVQYSLKNEDYSVLQVIGVV